jgi:hypothetical protein
MFPTTRTPDRPDHSERERLLYLRSYLLMRTVIGFTGVALPIVLMIGDTAMFGGEFPRGSVSAYYHSGMGDFFVSGLSAIGVFLVTYMVFHYNWDNILSIIAGVAVLLVALFPTGGNTPLTPMQELIGEDATNVIHFSSATIFILSLCVICIMFGIREGSRPDRTPAQHQRGKRLHWGCAGAIVVAVLFIAITKLTGVLDEKSLFFGETIAAFAFGISWFVKGLELDILRGRQVEVAVIDAAETASAV